MESPYLIATLKGGLRISYVDERPQGDEKGVIVLLHGFPQTSYQFRHVVKPLASSG